MRKIVSLFLCVLMTFSFSLAMPVAVHAEDSIPISQFVADNHVLMTRADGRFIGWGDNTHGQLGLGASGATSYTKPIEITFFRDKGKIKQIAAIKDASFALLNSGELYSCGNGTFGKLGQGDTYDKKSWSSVSTSLKFKKLYTNSGAEFVLAEEFNGSLYGWGKNADGQLGVGDTNARTSPTLVKASANIKQLWLGEKTVSYIDLDGKLYHWGKNDLGQFGTYCSYKKTSNTACFQPDGSPYYNLTSSTTTIDACNEASLLTPTLVSKVTKPASQPVPVNSGSSYAYLTWVTYSNWLSSSVFTIDLSNVKSVYMGSNHGIVAYTDGLYGWGDATSKQLGAVAQTAGTVALTSINTFLANQKALGVNLTKLFVDKNSNYMTFDNGSVYVWGDNSYNKAGVSGAPVSIDTPAKITALQDKKIIKVVAGRNTNYYITDAGDIYVSGSNVNGVTGLGDNYKNEATIDTPTKIDNLGFSETLEPPTAPLKITVPDKAEEEAKIDVAWDAAQGAAKYELKRTVTLRSGTTTSAATPAVVYDGDKTAYSDTAKPEWQTVAYELQAKNSIGDYSTPVTSNEVSITTKASGTNKAPTISAIQNQILNKNGSAALTFSVNDEDDAESVLTVTAASNYTSLIPSDSSHLAVTGPDTNGNCSVKVKPQTDSVSDTPATITLTVQDPANAKAITSFTVTVNPNGTISSTGTTATSSGVVIPPININLKQPDTTVQTQPSKSVAASTYPELNTTTAAQTPAANTAMSSWLPTPAQLAALGLGTNTGNNNAPYVITIQPSAPQAVQQSTANNNNTALYVIVFVLIAVIVAIVAFAFASMIFNKNAGELHRIRFMLSELFDSND